MDEKFECIIVGGGIAGLSAAMVLARADVKFLLVERGSFFGAKNVSGGVLWGSDLARLVPEYWKENRGIERFVRHRRLTLLDESSSFSIDFKSEHFSETPYSGVIVLRARFDAWLAEEVQAVIAASPRAEDSLLATDVLVEELVLENGSVAGIRAGGETFLADCVIIAEGVNNLLTRQIGLQKSYVPAKGMATAAKEIIRFDRRVLEDRFQLGDRSGLSNEFLGTATQGVEGGGFLYTNRDTVSLGVVLALDDLREKQLKPYDILNAFKEHPVVADMIRGGDVVEYSAHMVSSGDMRVLPREVFSDGVLVAGEAAHLVLNSGKAIQGMDYAMRSGILAAETVIRARELDDYSAGMLAGYRAALEDSYVMKDLRAFQSAVSFLHSPEMFSTVPRIACEFGRDFFTIQNRVTPKARTIVSRAIGKHSSLWNMLKLARKAFSSL